MERAFHRKYHWHRLAFGDIGCAALLGRTRREFEMGQISIMRIARVRSRAQVSSVNGIKRRRVAESIELTFVDHEEEDRVFGGLLEFFNQARVLSRTWALAGLFDVTLNNKEVTFCGWSEATECFSNIEERVIELQPGAYAVTSVIAYVAAVEESFLAKAIEWVCGLVLKYPFGLAMLEAQRQLAGKWEQRRDLVYANQSRTSANSKPAPPQPSKAPKGKSKGSGKKLHGEKLIRFEDEDAGRPLQLRDRGQDNDKSKLDTVDK